MKSFPEARILDVDLTKEEVTAKKLSSEIYRLYPGGSALALYLILKEMSAPVDPLSEDNILIFSVSPLTGLPISGQSRLSITTKSPLSEGIADSQSGGFFPAHLKFNGWDALLFRGRAKKPVYLYIDGEKAEIKAAGHLWGKDTGEGEAIIKKELKDDRLEIAQIGPAGERLVRYASIITMCNRANGRTGTGAVMGSKNLKAVVVKKGKARMPSDKKAFYSLTKKVKERIENNPAVAGLGKHGTAGCLEEFNTEGFLPTRNWQSGWFSEGADAITGQAMTASVLVGSDTCYACAVRCKRIVEVPGMVDSLYGGPEYETCAAFGSYCGIKDLESITRANQLCNMYGLDTISCGATIAFAMECFEKGYINSSHTDGLDLMFGNSGIVEQLVKMIAFREGIGDLLAEGSRRAAEKIGGNAPFLSITVKGQELPAHMPQAKPSLGLIYAVNPFGADHQSSEHDPNLLMPPDSQERLWLAQIGIWKGYDNPFELDSEKVRFAFAGQCFYSILDTLGLCQFVWGPSWQLYGPADMVNLCKYGIGWETSLYELMLAGERRINMMRFFNTREGFTRRDDRLPERLFFPLPDGPAKGTSLDKFEFYKALNDYYRFAGWDVESGNPTKENLKRLSLNWLLDGDD